MRNSIRQFIAAAAIAVPVALAVVMPDAAMAHEATNGGVTVAHAWARAMPEGAKVGAAYLEIKTDAQTADKLLSVTTPVAGRAEIHTHIMDGDVMKMRKLDSIDLPPGTSHVLKPMGDHLMLMDMSQPLKEGDLIPLTLTFASAGAITIDATVEPVGANGPHGMDHQPVDDGGSAHQHDSGAEKSGGETHQH